MAKSKKTISEWEKQAKEILQEAEETGVQSHFLFATTFERYMTQIKVLEALKETIDNEDMLVSKEYVKGRKNLYINPAVAEYNRTTDSANKTASTLMKIIKNFGVEESTEDDPLILALQGTQDGADVSE